MCDFDSFALLKRKQSPNISKKEALRILENLAETKPEMGKKIEISCTPFGSVFPTLFHRSLVKGIVSGVRNNGTLFLTDARLAPGCEGAPCMDEDGRLLGVVLTSVAWVNYEWLGFSICVSISGLLNRTPLYTNTDEDLRVALIDSAFNFGSGIRISADLILTCGHVVANNEDVSINGTQVKLLYKSRGAFDVALLKSNSASYFDITEDIKIGDSVSAVGFGLDRQLLKSSGFISALKKDKIILTSCPIQRGMSGGALIHNGSGKVCGILTSYIIDEDENGASFPHLSLAIPLGIIVRSIRDSGGDFKALDELLRPDYELKSLWNLNKL